MQQDIRIEQLLERRDQEGVTLVDVRSPSEYDNMTIPGSVNIPLFDDKERAEIGTIYNQQGIEAAKERGLEIVSAKLPEFIREFKRLGTKTIVYCWRGGMRSRTTATLLSLMGLRVSRLEGGIRSYRRWVVQTLENYKLDAKVYVLNGHTGTGKTIILQRLQEEGYPVIDLEMMAGHRGSVFGHIGLAPHNQKRFDSLLVQKLLELRDSPYILLEAESKRIGRTVIPEFLFAAKQQGESIWIDIPIDVRVQNILHDYDPHTHKEESLEAFRHIKSRIHTPVAAEIEQHLVEDRFADAVKLLLEHYYDARYDYSRDQYPRQEVLKVTDVDEAVKAVKSYIASVAAVSR